MLLALNPYNCGYEKCEERARRALRIKKKTTCLTAKNEDTLDVSNLLELALSQLGYSRERIIRYTFLVEEALDFWRRALPADAPLTVLRRDARKTVTFEFSLSGEKVEPFAEQTSGLAGEVTGKAVGEVVGEAAGESACEAAREAACEVAVGTKVGTAVVAAVGSTDYGVFAVDYAEARMVDRLLSGVGNELTYFYKNGINCIRLTLPKDNIESRIFRSNTLLLMIPIALQCLFSNVAAGIATLMLGTMDATAMSGVSLASAFTLIPLVLIDSAICGETTLLAQYWGKHDRESTQQVVSLSLMTGLGIALLFSLAAFFAPQMIMGLYSNNEEIVSAAAVYLRWTSPGFLIFAVYMSLFTFLQCTGGVKKVLRFSLAGCICSVVLNVVLIFGVCGIPAMGVRGAAIASVASVLVQALLAIREVRRQGIVKLRFVAKYSINCKEYARCVITIAAQRLSWNVANNIIIAAIGHMSADIVAANSALLVLSTFILSLKTGFGKGVGIQIGALLGKNRFDEAKQRASDMQKCGSVVALIMVPIFALLGFSLRFLSSDFSSGTIHYMNLLLLVYSVSTFFNFMNSMENLGFLYAGGDVKALLAIDTVVMWGVMVPLALLSINTTLIPVEVALVILESSEVISFPLKLGRVRQHKWVRNLS